MNFLWRLPETLIGRILVTLAFIPAYVAYVRRIEPCLIACLDMLCRMNPFTDPPPNPSSRRGQTNWQPCRYVDFDSKLGARKWFSMNDANWLLNCA